MSPQPDDAFAELIVKHQAGELGPEEEAAFTALLEDPSHRRRFMEHTLLSVALIRAPASATIAAAAPRAHAAPRWTWWVVGAAIAASLAVGVGATVLSNPSTPSAPVIAVIYDAAPGALVHRGELDIPASPGMDVRDGDGLLASSGVLGVRWNHEETTIELAADAQATLRDGGTGKRVALGAGSITAEVAKQPVGKPLVVTAPEAEATVIGTRFTFSREPAGARLAVEHGLVGLRRLADGATVEVPAGRAAIAGTVTTPAGRGHEELGTTAITWNSWRRFGLLPVWQLPMRAEIDADDAAGHDALLATSEPVDLAPGAELCFTFSGPVSAQGWRIEVLALASLDPGAREAVAWQVEARDAARTDLGTGVHRVRFLFAEREWRASVDGEPVARFRYAEGLTTGGKLHLGLRASAQPGTVPLMLGSLAIVSPADAREPAPAP